MATSKTTQTNDRCAVNHIMLMKCFIVFSNFCLSFICLWIRIIEFIKKIKKRSFSFLPLIMNIFSYSGPQRAAIHLLSTLTSNDTGVVMVIGTNSLVAMLLCCMKESHCRYLVLDITFSYQESYRVATHVLQVLHDSTVLMLAKQNFKHSSKQKAQYLRSVQFIIFYIITNEQSIHMVR